MTKTWTKLRRALVDARRRATQRGKAHWSSAFPHIEAWIMRRTASVAASEPGSELSSLADSETDFPTVTQVLGTEGSAVGNFEVHEPIEVDPKMADLTSTAMSAMGTAMPAQETAMPENKGTIETIQSNVPIVQTPQATSSVAGSAEGMFTSRLAELIS